MAWNKTKGIELRRCIYHGNKSDFTMLEAFLKANNFDRMHTWGGGDQVETVLKSGTFASSKRRFVDEKNPPYIDHAKYFKSTVTGICCLTYNPYYDADHIKPEVIAWATSLGLKAEVYDSSKSWYYPDSTCFVVISLNGIEIKLK